ncbi:MAG: sigma-54 dependent transcriptional regulator [Bacteroidales bacterium]|nr:sigma-54 dependent transcriptional regulator [Bacteroidales bacterium]
MKHHILIVEDDVTFGAMLKSWFERNAYEVSLFSNLASAKQELKKNRYSLILSDLRLPDGDGIMLLQWVKEQNLTTPFMIMTSYAEVQSAVAAIKLGAEDYLEKPIVPSVFKEKIVQALEKSTKPLKQQTKQKRVISQEVIIGNSKVAKQMHDYILRIAPTKMSILIIGESGTGKEYAAKMIHDHSPRKNRPFVAVDCGSLSKELAPSELFGHLKGSFTSAIDHKTGVFELANGGTLFLDEVGNLHYEVQMQLLRTLQEQRVRRVGSAEDIPVDVRILAATNENLDQSIVKGRFREDLYHRLNEFSLFVPPLRDRGNDIKLFAAAFLKQANDEFERNVKVFSPETVMLLEKRHWSGNLRELRNVIRRAVLFASGDEITPSDLPVYIEPKTEEFTLRPQNEKEQIEAALQQARGNKSLAAHLLKIDRKTLYNKMHLYGIIV